ncbi:unnamed protein product [Ectocarpus sp. 4 AP-2014]
MTIVYALIARGKAVLAEFTATAGNFPTVTRVLLNKIPAEATRMSYVWDAHVFHYIVENGVTYLCMADEQSRRRVPFAFLEDIKTKFGAQYGASIHTAPAFSMNAEFAPILQRQMDAFNSNPPGDSLQGVRSQIEDVRAGMLENVDKVLERGEKIELLVDKTDQLNQQAFRFDRASRSLRRTMYWRKVKTGVAAAGVAVILMFAAGATACGGVTFSHCRS